MKINNKKDFKIKYFVLFIFFEIYNFCFADTNYKSFEKMFREGAKIGGGSVIGKCTFLWNDYFISWYFIKVESNFRFYYFGIYDYKYFKNNFTKC